MDGKCVSDTAWRLERLQRNFYIESALTGKIEKLKQELRFLKTYLMYVEISRGGHRLPTGTELPMAFAPSSRAYDYVLNLELKHYGSRLHGMEVAFMKVNADLHNAMNKICLCGSRAAAADPPVTVMLNLMKGFEPQIRADYFVFLEKKPWEYESALVHRFWMDFTGSVIENLKDLLQTKLHLIGSLRKLVESLQEKLIFLQNFVDRTTPRSKISYRGMRALSVYPEVAAALAYLGWVDDEADQTMASRMENELSHLLQSIKPSTPDLMELYFAFLKASEPTRLDNKMTDEAASFVNFIMDDSEGSMKDQLADIRDALEFLITFVIDLPDKYCKEDEKQISVNIQTLARKAVSLNLQLQGNEVTESKAKEMNFLLSMLLENMKLIKAEISLIKLMHLGYPQRMDMGEEFAKPIHFGYPERMDMEEEFAKLTHLGYPQRIQRMDMEEEFAALHEGLKLLRTFFVVEEETSKDSKMFFSQFAKLAHEVTSLISSIHMNTRKSEFNLELLLFFGKLKLIMSEVDLTKLQNQTANWMLSVKDEIEMLRQDFVFLRAYLTDSKDIEDQTEEGKLFLEYLKAVTTESSSFISSFCLDDLREERLNEFSLGLLKWVEKIKLIKAEVVLTLLLNHETTPIVHKKDQIQKLQQDLRFFKSFLMDLPSEYKEDGELISGKIEAAVNKEVTLISSIWKEDGTVQINFSLSELLKRFMDLKGEIGQMYLHVSQSFQPKHPRIDGLGFISSLLLKMKELLKCRANSVSSGKHQIKMLLENLDGLRSFLIDIVEHHQEHEELKYLWICVTDIAHEAENVIDSFVVRTGPLWYRMLWLISVIDEVNVIKAKVMEAYDKARFHKRVRGITQTSNQMLSKTNSAIRDEVVVGCTDEAENIIGRLTRGSEEMNIVPIIGMPGIGKTTLAKKVYNDPSITFHFHIRAWSCISQVYRRRELLLDILGDIAELTHGIRAMRDEDIAEMLYRCLKGKRYLIVMDDLWDIGAWEDLRLSFPNDRNGSRILFTSRLHNVALLAKPNCDPHHLRLLSDNESWELLQEKVFHKESCPEALMEVGKEIARNCKGLPLAVVVIAGLLGRTEKKLDWWKQVSQSLSFQIFADPERQCKHVLELSYNHLPDHLKPCFLYFGAFPENKEIPVSKLRWLWVAEGFSLISNSKSLEDSAEEYLLDLIARSLVTVAKRGSDGGVKACSIHGLLRLLCVEKAKEQNFLELIDGYDELLTTTADGFGCWPSYPLIYDQRRLCICSKRKHLTTLKPRGPCVRCLLFFASNDAKPRESYDISFVCHSFKLIRVMDLESINMGCSFPTGLEQLALLRYLAVRGTVTSIPSSVANLWNLETFLLKGLRGEVKLPDSFWKMGSLRHVHINDRVAFSSEFNEFESDSLLDNVTTLSTPVLYPGKQTEKMMRRFPRLRKLKCIFFDQWNCIKFPVLDFLSNLESLKVVSYFGGRHGCEFKLPLNIKKLTLSKFCRGVIYQSLGNYPTLRF